MFRIIILIFILIGCFAVLKASAQKHYNPRSFVKDSTPIELLNYNIRQDVFLNNYGLDDTSRALINMFFRKRKIAFLESCGVPTGGLILTIFMFDASTREIKKTGESGPGGTLLLSGLLSGLTSLIIIPVDGLINNITYSRKKLLYTLVKRERGIPVPVKILAELKPKDFRK